MDGLAEVLQPLLILVVAFALLGAVLIGRRRLLWDLPLIIIMLLVAAGGVAGLWLDGELADMFAIGTLIVALALAEIPSLFQRQALQASIQGRHKASRRWATIYWVLRPGAKARLMVLTARLIEQVREGQRSIPEAMGQIPRFKRVDVSMALLIRGFHSRLYAVQGDWSGLAERYDPLRGPLYAHPPSGAGELMVRALGEVGRLDDAGRIVEQMEQTADSGKLTPPESDAFHNRARLTLLAYAGRGPALKATLRPGSTLRALMTGEEREALTTIASQRERAGLGDAVGLGPLLNTVEERLRIESRLTHSFSHLSAPSPIVVALIAVNVLVFVAASVGGSMLDPEYLIHVGGCLQGLVWDGAWWRLFSSMWLHAGAIHLVFNSLFLLIFGNITARLVGSWRFSWIYLLSGLAGSAAHLLFGAPGVMVGASGAIFGVFGAAVAAVFINRERLPSRWARRNMVAFIAVLILNGYLSAAVEFVSFSAHAGGFVVGALVAATLLTVARYDPAQESPGERSRSIAALTAIGVVALVVSVWSVIGVTRSLSTPIDELIPLEEAEVSLEEGLSRATLELKYPVTWQLKVREAPYQRELGPRIVGFSGQLISTRVICRDALPRAFGELALDDQAGLVRALNRVESGRFRAAPGEGALSREPEAEGATLTFARLTPFGLIKQRYYAEEQPSGNGEALVKRMWRRAELVTCEATRP